MLTTLLSRSVTVSATDPVTLTLYFEQADGTWVDISADLISGTVRRGKQRELDKFQAGTCQLTLRNDSRQYDPNHATGPYFGSILPMRRMRVMAIANNTLYSAFTGYVDSWDQNYTGPHSATATVTLTDGFKPLAVAGLPTSPYFATVYQDLVASRLGGSDLYRLNEAPGTTVINDTASGNYDSTEVIGAPTFGVPSLVAMESSDTAMQLSSSGQWFQVYPDFFVLSTDAFSFEFLVRITGTPTTDIEAYQNLVPGFGSNTSIKVLAASGKVEFFVGNTAVSAASIVDGLIHHVVCTREFNDALTVQTLKIYIDGVLDTTLTGFGSNLLSTAMQTRLCRGADGALVTFDEVAFYYEAGSNVDGALSAATVAAHYAAATAPWVNDSPGTRVGRILDLIDWSVSDRVLSAGASVLQAATIGNQKALEHLQKVSQSEFGDLFVDANGAVVLRGRNDSVDQPSRATFADRHNVGLAARVVTPEYSDQLIKNDVTISRAGGVARNAQDATSIGQYLIHSYALSGLIHNSDDLSLRAAQHVVAQYKDPLQRISGLVVEAHADPVNLFPQVLGRELLDRITVTYTPQGIPPAISQLTVIEGLTHSFTPKRWTTAYDLSPADAKPYWQLGVAGYSELGATTRTFF
jgi:hypothetical protein